MKVSIPWLKELVELNMPIDEVVKLINLKTIGTKEVTEGFIELDMKGHHRADLLSMRGVAYEVAAITDSKILYHEPYKTEFVWNDVIDEEGLETKVKNSLAKLSVQVENREKNPIYLLAKVEGLKVGPSPEEWVKKLADSGMRSVNNVADITNLIMLEYGQPLHSFDAKSVKDEKIIVRTAEDGEEIETLDGKKRVLTKEDLVIADPEKAVGIAGVMGGKNSEVVDSTDTILLEAAIFEPISIRKTASRLGLPSEASRRFQNGLTKTRLFQALDAAVKMYQLIGGKLTAIYLEEGELLQWHNNSLDPVRKVDLSLKKTVGLIGTEISGEQVKDYLTKLGCYFPGHRLVDGGESWAVTPPYWRLDLNIEEDLIEEVARMYGYDKIPAKPLPDEEVAKIDQSLFETIYNLKKTLADEGLTEVQTYSFASMEVLKNVGFYPDHLDALVKIANPISSETEYLRMLIWQNLLEVVAKNFKQGYEDIGIFEVGKMYAPKNGGVEEDYDLGIALMNGSDNPVEELYQIFKKAMEKMGHNLELEDIEVGPIDQMLFHPTRVKNFKIDGEISGGIAEVHPRIVNKFGMEKRVAIIEVPVKSLLKR